jgi:hypothetical protein
MKAFAVPNGPNASRSDGEDEKSAEEKKKETSRCKLARDSLSALSFKTHGGISTGPCP